MPPFSIRLPQAFAFFCSLLLIHFLSASSCILHDYLLLSFGCRLLQIGSFTQEESVFVSLSIQVRFKHVRWVAIDEADFLLTQNFKDLYWILEKLDSESRVGAKKIRYTLSMASITKPVLRLLSDDPRWKDLREAQLKKEESS